MSRKLPPIKSGVPGGNRGDKLALLSDEDQKLISQLQQKLEAQRSEISHRTAAIDGIQRNFESLSSVVQCLLNDCR